MVQLLALDFREEPGCFILELLVVFIDDGQLLYLVELLPRLLEFIQLDVILRGIQSEHDEIRIKRDGLFIFRRRDISVPPTQTERKPEQVRLLAHLVMSTSEQVMSDPEMVFIFVIQFDGPFDIRLDIFHQSESLEYTF